jgi:hypothetical protein
MRHLNKNKLLVNWKSVLLYDSTALLTVPIIIMTISDREEILTLLNTGAEVV